MATGGLACRLLARVDRGVVGVDGWHRGQHQEGHATIGTDLSRFASVGHLASWAGLCPGTNESAGKHRSGRTRKGSVWLRTALVQAANAAARTKGTYLAAQYARIKGRRGHQKAIVALAHSILVIAWHLLQRSEPTATWAATTS
jgi:transposase